VAGAVANPVTGELFRAVRGGGAHLERMGTDAPATRLTGPRDVPLARSVIGTGFGYDPGRRARQVALVADLLPRIADIRRLGSASLDLCAVAAGHLDGYFEIGLNHWDYAAGVLVAQEAGCGAAGLGGGAPTTALTAVARPDVLRELIALLTEYGVDAVL
jgi:myo-inositol-1(or 4)-monophosphatase